MTWPRFSCRQTSRTEILYPGFWGSIWESASSQQWIGSGEYGIIGYYRFRRLACLCFICHDSFVVYSRQYRSSVVLLITCVLLFTVTVIPLFLLYLYSLCKFYECGCLGVSVYVTWPIGRIRHKILKLVDFPKPRHPHAYLCCFVVVLVVNSSLGHLYCCILSMFSFNICLYFIYVLLVV